MKKPDVANACQVQQGTNHRFAANNQDKLSYSGGRNRILDTAVQRHLRQVGWRSGNRPHTTAGVSAAPLTATGPKQIQILNA